MIYFYKQGTHIMDADQAEEAMKNLEASLRKGTFKYKADSVFQSQIDDIKKSWPEEHRSYMRGLVSKEGPEPSPPAIRRAMDRTLMESVAHSRATLRNTSVQTEMKAISADLCLSMLYRVAPDASPSGGRRKFGNVMVITRTLGEFNPRRVIVKQSDAGSADRFVFFVYNSELCRSWAVGWMTRYDVEKMPCGNKLTNPMECSWSATCHYGSVEKLRPMSELLHMDFVMEPCEGVLMESVPDMDDVPVKTKTQMEEYMNGRESSADEFWQALGMDNPAGKGER